MFVVVQYRDEIREKMLEVIEDDYGGIDDYAIESLLLNYIMFDVSRAGLASKPKKHLLLAARI